jgi:tetratricopeptide (TPR) repeat protein
MNRGGTSRRVRWVIAAGAAMLASSTPLSAQERPDSGGVHRETSHDAAPPLDAPRLGALTFATSATPAAHAAFVRGMLYLHNFHYPQAAAAFREAQQLDPGDVMSFWGEAVSYTHPVWNEQDTSAARAVLKRLAATPAERLAKARTKHERAWLATAEALYDNDVSKARRDTLWAASLDQLRTAYPSDVDAQLFYALSLLGLNEGDRDVPTYLRAYAIARRVFRTHPNHPGAAHYVIHAVDDPAHASLGLDAARAYSRIAPDAGHAQHMTSHIFIALGMWDDVIDANMRAQNPPHSQPRRQYGHGVQWLAYALLQEGRFAEAGGWVDSMRAQTDRYAANAKVSKDAVIESRSYLVLDRAAYVADTRDWHSPLATLDIDTTGLDVHDLAANDLALGAAALGRGERARADSMLARTRARNARARAGAGEGEEPASEIGYARVIEKTLEAMTLHASGNGADAVTTLVSAAALDDSLPFAFGPPVEIVQPHELAGEYLLELGKASDAKREYTLALGRAPGRTAALIGLATAQVELRQRTDARKSYALAAKNLAHADGAATTALAKLRARLDAEAPPATR